MMKYLKYSTSLKFRYSLFVILAILLTITVACPVRTDNKPILSPYPFGANFAFTITEDPDASWFDEAKLVYDFLEKKGLRTTIAVWVRKATRSNGIPDVANLGTMG